MGIAALVAVACAFIVAVGVAEALPGALLSILGSQLALSCDHA